MFLCIELLDFTYLAFTSCDLLSFEVTFATLPSVFVYSTQSKNPTPNRAAYIAAK